MWNSGETPGPRVKHFPKSQAGPEGNSADAAGLSRALWEFQEPLQGEEGEELPESASRPLITQSPPEASSRDPALGLSRAGSSKRLGSPLVHILPTPTSSASPGRMW